MKEKMIIRNGILVHKGTETGNIYISKGKIVSPFKEDNSCEIVDAGGCYVSPGFIDCHVHVFEEETKLGIHADKIGIAQGVSTVVDAGSTGLNHFPIFKKEIIGKNKTRILYMLNISRKGLCDGSSELKDMEDLMSVQELDSFMKVEKDLVGLKVRMSSSIVQDNGLSPLLHARILADTFDLPLMIHIGNAPPKLGDILSILKKGDIVTHIFHGKKGGALEYLPEIQKAAERGVLFDVGHGTASFSFRTAQKVLEKYPLDYSISTDIYKQNYNHPVGSLLNTMSKFLSMGLSVQDVVAKVTMEAAKNIRRGDLGNLEEGSHGDVIIFDVVKPTIPWLDAEGCEIPATGSLRLQNIIYGGNIIGK